MGEDTAVWMKGRKRWWEHAACAGVSDPPGRWHSGPKVKLKLGDPVWYVESLEWPRHAVQCARYLGSVTDVSQAAQLETTGGHTMVVALARVFVSRQEAVREAEVLEMFAGGRVEARYQTKVELVRLPVVCDRRRELTNRRKLRTPARPVALCD
jgi:hypothetical protein